MNKDETLKHIKKNGLMAYGAIIFDALLSICLAVFVIIFSNHNDTGNNIYPAYAGIAYLLLAMPCILIFIQKGKYFSVFFMLSKAEKVKKLALRRINLIKNIAKKNHCDISQILPELENNVNFEFPVLKGDYFVYEEKMQDFLKRFLKNVSFFDVMRIKGIDSTLRTNLCFYLETAKRYEIKIKKDVKQCEFPDFFSQDDIDIFNKQKLTTFLYAILEILRSA